MKKILFLLLTNSLIAQYSSYQMFVTNQNEKLVEKPILKTTPKSIVGEWDNYILINPNIKHQTFLGIGGAITDASAEVFYTLPKNKQTELLNAYYGKNGIGYSLGRTTIHSSDFSSASYTYTQDNDSGLKSFSIAHDQKYRVPLLKEIFALRQNDFTLFASPWSPPAWMKTNNDMLNGGKLKKEHYKTWANYITKFIEAYQKENIKIWGLTIQNEPKATQRWESCIYSGEEEADFLKNYLYPSLKANRLSDKKLIIWDHNRNDLVERSTATLDPETRKLVWGVGYHWYEDWTVGRPMYENVSKVKSLFPEKNMLFTEGCNAPFDANKLNEWTLGEKYGTAMINDFNAGAVGWTDWNILLDEKGGPNHVDNFCFAPVHTNAQHSDLVYTNAFYYIAHFSKFIQKNAQHIEISNNNPNLQTTAFLNPNKKIVVVVMNQSDKDIEYKIIIAKTEIKQTANKHSIYTFLIN